MGSQTKHFYAFGPFRLDAEKRVLVRAGTPITLPPKAAETLLLLVQRAGHLVEKDELMAVVWPDSFVEEGNLTKNVFFLRKTLGEWDGGRGYIETVPKWGYRFVVPVQEVTHAELAPSLPAIPSSELVGRKVSHYRVLTESGQVKILDFGLAKLTDTEAQTREELPSQSVRAEPQHGTPADLGLTRTGVALGTAGYMSPEQIRGERLDARSDLFSFGLVLYELATGRVRWDGCDRCRSRD
jgi:DNA-binding winged helix-turn-helix (wHTH) protein